MVQNKPPQTSIIPGHSCGLQSRVFIFDSSGHPTLPKLAPLHMFSQVCDPPPQLVEHSPKSVHISTA